MKTINGKRMCKALEAKGWTLARETGSHRIFVHQKVPNQPPCFPRAGSPNIWGWVIPRTGKWGCP